MKLTINGNNYIDVNNNKIEIKYNDYVLKFNSLQEMINAFLPGVLRTCENNRKLAEMEFNTSEKSFFWAKVYDDGMEQFIIVARNLKEAELLFDNFLNETYYDIEYEGVYDIESYYCDDEELNEFYEEYSGKEIGVYEW